MSKITKYFSYISNITTLLSKDRSPNKDVEFFSLSYLKYFLNFIENDTTIQKFLATDKCNLLADKYLIALTFAYYVRARIPVTQFDTLTFFAALHIAHDMEEDELLLKRNLCNWTSRSWEDDERFYEKRRLFLEMINFRAVVSQEMCEKIMNMEETKNSSLWKRERSSTHAGAINKRFRGRETCESCREDKIHERLQRYYRPFGDGYLTISESESSDDDSFSENDNSEAVEHHNNEAKAVDASREKQEEYNVLTKSDENIYNKCSPIIPDYSECPLFPDYSDGIPMVNIESSAKPTIQPPLVTTVSNETNSITTAPNTLCATPNTHLQFTMNTNNPMNNTTATNETCSITTAANETCSVTTATNETCSITIVVNETSTKSNLQYELIKKPDIEDPSIFDINTIKNRADNKDLTVNTGLNLTPKKSDINKLSQNKNLNTIVEVKKASFEEMLNELEKSLEEMGTKSKQHTKLFETTQSPNLISRGTFKNRSSKTKEKNEDQQKEAIVLDKNIVNREGPRNTQEARKTSEFQHKNVNDPSEKAYLGLKVGSKQINLNGELSISETQLPSWKALHRKIDSTVEVLNSSLLDNTCTRNSTPVMSGKVGNFSKLKTDFHQEHSNLQMIVEHYKTQDPKLHIRDSKIQLSRKLTDLVKTDKIIGESPNLDLENSESKKGDKRVFKQKLSSDLLQSKLIHGNGKFPTTKSQVYEKSQPCLIIDKWQEQNTKKMVTDNEDKLILKKGQKVEVPHKFQENRVGTLASQTKGCTYKSNFLTPDRPKTGKSTLANKLQNIDEIKMTPQQNTILENDYGHSRDKSEPINWKIEEPQKSSINSMFLHSKGETRTNTLIDKSKNIQKAREEKFSIENIDKTSYNDALIVQCFNEQSSNNEKNKQLPELSNNEKISSNPLTTEDLKIKKQTEITSVNPRHMGEYEKSSSVSLTHQTKHETININEDHSKAREVIKTLTIKYQNDLKHNQHSDEDFFSVKFPAARKEHRIREPTILSLEEMKQEQTNILERMQKKFGTQKDNFKEKEDVVKRTDKASVDVRQTLSNSSSEDREPLTNKDKNNNHYHELNMSFVKNNNKLIDKLVPIKHASENCETHHNRQEDIKMTGEKSAEFKPKTPIIRNDIENHKYNTQENNIPSVEKVLTMSQQIQNCLTTENKSAESKAIIRVIRDYVGDCQCNTKGIKINSEAAEFKQITHIVRYVPSNHHSIIKEKKIPSIKISQELETVGHTENKAVYIKLGKPALKDVNENYYSNTKENKTDSIENFVRTSKDENSTSLSEPKGKICTELVLFDMTNNSIAPVHSTMKSLIQSISEMNNQMKMLGNKIEGIESQISNKRKVQIEEDSNPRKMARLEKSAEQIFQHENICYNDYNNNNPDDDIMIIKENIVTRYNIQLIRCPNTEQLGNAGFPAFITDRPIKTEKISEIFETGKEKVQEPPQTLQKQSGLIEHTNSKHSQQAREKCFGTTQISISIPENSNFEEKYLHLKIRKIRRSKKK